MKCFNCGKNEAVFSEDCLVVEHKVSDFMTTRMESERLVGVTRAGLCPRCLNEAAQNCMDLAGPPLLMKAAGVIFVVGLALFFLGDRIDAPMATPKLNLIKVIGLGLAAVTGLYLLLRNLLAPTLLKKTPWKVMGRREGAMMKLVPLGEGRYRDYRQFNTYNLYLSKKVSEDIYRQIIETGAWRAMVEANREQGPDRKNTDALGG